MARAVQEAPVFQFDQVAFGSLVRVVDPAVVAPDAEFWLGIDGSAPGEQTIYSQLSREYLDMPVEPDRSREARGETG